MTCGKPTLRQEDKLFRGISKEGNGLWSSRASTAEVIRGAGNHAIHHTGDLAACHPMAEASSAWYWDSIGLKLPVRSIGGRKNQLKTSRQLVGARGFEPRTPCAQGRCAT